MFTQWVRRFAKSTGGNVALITALTATPMAMATGIAVDFGRQAYLKSQFDTIADTISLQTVDQDGMTMSASAAQALAQTNFNKLATQVNPGATVTSSIVVTSSASGRKAVVTYTASIPASIMGIFGTKTLTAGGTSTANSANSSYMDIYVLADNTPSMGMGATTADVTALQNLTANYPSSTGAVNCGFACHDTLTAAIPYPYNQSYVSDSRTSTYSLVKANGITMRIDSVRNAINSMLSTAASLPATIQANMRFAIYDFGTDASTTGLTSVYNLNSSISSAQAALSAPNFDLMTVPAIGYKEQADTPFAAIFNSLNTTIPSSGDGSTAALSRKLLVFVSDGMEDDVPSSGTCASGIWSPNSGEGNRCMAPFNSALCNTLKSNGVIIAAIYTTYLPNASGLYNPYIQNSGMNNGPYSPSPNSLLAQGMQGCASPGFYQEVGPSDSITATMNNMFNQFISKYARITG